jgi:hypothetical protein
MGAPGHFLLLETGAEAVASTAGVPNQIPASESSRLTLCGYLALSSSGALTSMDGADDNFPSLLVGPWYFVDRKRWVLRGRTISIRDR